MATKTKAPKRGSVAASVVKERAKGSTTRNAKPKATRNGEPYSGVAFSVRVRDDATRKRLQAAAKKQGVSMTAFMRNAVTSALDSTLKRSPK